MFEKVAEGLNFPEGPAWDYKGALYFSNCYGGWIGKYSEEKGLERFLEASEDPFTFGKTNGMTFHKDGSLFACDFEKHAIIRFTMDGKSEIYADGCDGNPLHKPNDLTFDKQGNLYFTDPHKYSKKVHDGFVYRVSAKDKKVSIAAKELAFPNGLIFSADGKKLYVCESAMSRLIRFDVQPDGSLSNKEVFVEVPGGDPDGINFDVEGNLYIAHFGGGAVIVVKPDGTILKKIKTPGKKPSNVEFAGDDLKTLYITEDETNCLYRIKVDIPGLPLW